MKPKLKKCFVAFFRYIGFHISLGISINPILPDIEIHLPFGFIRIGWEERYFMDDKRFGIIHHRDTPGIREVYYEE